LSGDGSGRSPVTGEVGSVACIGCGGLVPDIDGPSHRYMLASPGCWAAYTGMLGVVSGPVPAPYGSLTVDAYAVQHPGVPNPQATQSVWVHLIALHLVLEAGWPASRLVRVRQLAADASAGWPWLAPPGSMGPVTAIDVESATPGAIGEMVRAWVEGAWAAWDAHHPAVREQARVLIARLG
jgi:hypothetical protein